jgi:fucose 4-O-acetylase-like acetyltransferase
MIILVVAFHAFVPIPMLDMHDPITVFGYMLAGPWFHMPVFFMLSGLFLIRSMSKPTGQYITGKLKTLVYPYVLWTTIYVVMTTIFAGAAGRSYAIADLPYHILIDPVLHLWFMHALFLNLLLILILTRLKVNKWLIFCLSLAFFAILQVWVGVDFMRPFLHNSIYITTGMVAAPLLLDQMPRLKTPALIALTIAGYALLMWLVLQVEIYDDTWPSLLAGLTGIAASITLCILLDRVQFPLLRFIGQHSLEIYLMHVLILGGTRTLLTSVAGFDLTPAVQTVMFLVAVIAPLITVWFFRQINFNYGFSFGTR